MDSDFFTKALAGSDAKVVGLDPGETVGAVCFAGSRLVMAKQLKGLSVPEVFKNVRAFIALYKPEVVVMEDYKVYSWKAQDHSWQSLFTPRLIGAIECYLDDVDITLVKQMAQQAKGFCTDEKLQAWGFWQKGERHSRDAIRHVCYYLLFNVAQVHKRNKS